MEITNNYIFKRIGKDYTLIPVRESNVRVDTIINLNETGAFIFKLIEKGLDKDSIVNMMIYEYDVTIDVLTKDVDEFIDMLIKKGIVKWK